MSNESEKQPSKFTFYGNVGGVAETVEGDMNSYIYNTPSQNLAKAAEEIQKLLKQLEKPEYASETAQKQAAEQLVEKAKKDPTFKEKFIELGQKAAKITASEALKNIVNAVLNAII